MLLVVVVIVVGCFLLGAGGRGGGGGWGRGEKSRRGARRWEQFTHIMHLKPKENID